MTAYTVTCAMGTSNEDVWRALREGRSGLGPSPYSLPFETVVGMVPGALAPLPEALSRLDSRQARILGQLLGAMDQPIRRAISRWGGNRVGLILGTSSAGNEGTEQAYRAYLQTGAPPSEFVYEHHIPHGLVDVARALLGVTGPGYVISTACSSSSKVFGTAQRLMKAGVCDAVIVGGIDTLCQLTLRGFHSLSLLSKHACRPFAADRDGISLGEGGALLLLEREGDGPAELLGVGESSDAFHMTSPHPEGLGAAAAMRQALDRAGLQPSQIDHVNAHGTATVRNDDAESKAIAAVVGERVPVASTKGYTGHTLGAAGAVEAVLAVMSIEHGFIPVSLGAEPVDPGVHLNIVSQPVRQSCRFVLSNSFAFGGNNASVVFGARA